MKEFTHEYVCRELREEVSRSRYEKLLTIQRGHYRHHAERITQFTDNGDPTTRSVFGFTSAVRVGNQQQYNDRWQDVGCKISPKARNPEGAVYDIYFECGIRAVKPKMRDEDQDADRSDDQHSRGADHFKKNLSSHHYRFIPEKFEAQKHRLANNGRIAKVAYGQYAGQQVSEPSGSTLCGPALTCHTVGLKAVIATSLSPTGVAQAAGKARRPRAPSGGRSDPVRQELNRVQADLVVVRKKKRQLELDLSNLTEKLSKKQKKYDALVEERDDWKRKYEQLLLAETCGLLPCSQALLMCQGDSSL